LAGIRRRVVAIFVALLVPATIAACGGGSSNNADPQQVLRETFSNPKSISSGKVDLSLGIDAQGSQSGSFNAAISGPFQSGGGKGTLPRFDLTGKLSGSAPGVPSISFEGGLTFTKDAGYVSYQGTAYRIPSPWFDQLRSLASRAARFPGSQQSVSSVFGSLGIKPATWFTNLSDEGTANVAGAETDHISGDVDVGKVAVDLRKLNELSQQIPGQTQKLTPAQLAKLRQGVRNAHVDIYSGTSDHLLRRLSVSLDLAPRGGAGAGITSLGVDFSLTLSDLNQPQTISRPPNVRPLPRSFLQQLQGLGSLGATSGLGGALGPGGGASPSGSSGGGSGAAANAQAQAYTRCILRAGGNSAAINRCLQKLSG
jgi:hypothetical protein